MVLAQRVTISILLALIKGCLSTAKGSTIAVILKHSLISVQVITLRVLIRFYMVGADMLGMACDPVLAPSFLSSALLWFISAVSLLSAIQTLLHCLEDGPSCLIFLIYNVKSALSLSGKGRL